MNRRTFLGRLLATPVALAGVVWGVKAGERLQPNVRDGQEIQVIAQGPPVDSETWVTFNVQRNDTLEAITYTFPTDTKFTIPSDCVCTGYGFTVEYNA